MIKFGERLKKAFNNDINAEIARKLGVSESAVTNYMNGRVPDGEKLLKIAGLTKCDLHWLLTGKGKPPAVVPQPTLNDLFERRVREIVREELSGTARDEVGEFEPSDIMLAPSFGRVNEEVPKEEKKRKTS